MSTTRRLNHIFRTNGRALIVAFDHGLLDGPAKGMERPALTLEKIVAGGADAILTTYGLATRFAKEIAPLGLILRLDGGSTVLSKLVKKLVKIEKPATMATMDNLAGPGAQFHTIADALRLGADAVAVSAFPGSAKEAATLKTLAGVIGEAHAWGLPVMGEMVPGGFDSPPDYRTAETIAIAARVAAELGADWVKVPYAEDFTQVTAGCYVPAVILGGAKKGSERVMLETIQAAVAAGAAGVAIGRNIFQAEDPAAMTAAVAAILHEGASVDEAMKIIGSKQ